MTTYYSSPYSSRDSKVQKVLAYSIFGASLAFLAFAFAYAHSKHFNEAMKHTFGGRKTGEHHVPDLSRHGYFVREKGATD